MRDPKLYLAANPRSQVCNSSAAPLLRAALSRFRYKRGMIPHRPHDLRPVRLPVLLAALSFPASTWESPLFGLGWHAQPTLSFETDKIVQDFSFAGYRRGETPLPRARFLPEPTPRAR